MPTVHREDGFRFFFFSNEGREPAHIHVERGDGYGKLWLRPVAWASADGFHASGLRQVLLITRRKADRFREQWNGWSGN